MRKLYIATALITFLAALAVQLPARVAWQWFADVASENEVSMIGVQGKLGDATASQLIIRSLSVQAPAWQASYWPLLIAQLHLTFGGHLDQYPVTGNLKVYPTGNLTVTDFEAASRLSRIAPLLQLPIMPLKGVLSLDINKITGNANQILSADGRAVIRNAEWMLMQPPASLGNLAADISTTDENISADLSSEGPLEIKGVSTLSPDGQYSIDIQLRTRSGADPRLGNLLKTLGQPNAGWYRFKTQGRITG